MRVLITGSSGQIGTNLGLALIERGDEVVGIDRRANAWTDRLKTIQLDLLTVRPEDLPKGPFDLVVHLAAHAKVFELVEMPYRALENVTSCFAALEYARRHKVPFVFGSSREVYGDIVRHVTEEAEADFVVAESPYSASKIAGEAFIYSFAECYGLPYLVFRFSNVYGRYDNDIERMERVLPLFIRRISRDEPIVIYGKEKVFDFTYVDDCIDGMLKGVDALAAGKVHNQTINLAYGQGSTLVDAVNIIGLALNKTPKVTYAPPRPGEVMRYVADISKARQLLGYEPQTPLTAGIPLSIRWAREHGNV
ncbi:MAG: NAD-dependent epimerase/dehydratase family protein [Planctomycetes bacterium]|nr:NAD-dependent epimerase/dehydratase family protein [Planctomycetota bacterium]